MADGRVRARLYLAEVEVRGRRGPVFVAELDTAIPLLGVYSLETLGFKINPRTGELEEISPEGGYLLKVMCEEVASSIEKELEEKYLGRLAAIDVDSGDSL